MENQTGKNTETQCTGQVGIHRRPIEMDFSSFWPKGESIYAIFRVDFVPSYADSGIDGSGDAREKAQTLAYREWHSSISVAETNEMATPSGHELYSWHPSTALGDTNSRS